MKDKPLKFRCPECPYSTKSEAQFVMHLQGTHAFRPHQVAREITKQIEQAA